MSAAARLGVPRSAVVHVAGMHVPRGLPAEFGEGDVPCCEGSAYGGARACTCWEPVYDLGQAALDLGSSPITRTKCCHDCAYRNDSPEVLDGDGPELRMLARTGRTPDGRPGEFWCHQGVRRVIGWRHPDGRTMPAGDGDYRPPVGPNAAGVQCIWRADGSAGERCAGWSAHRPSLSEEGT